MKKLFALMLAIVMIMTCSLALADRLADIQANGKLVVATSPDWPPYEYIDDEGNVTGTDVLMVEWMAEQLGAHGLALLFGKLARREVQMPQMALDDGKILLLGAALMQAPQKQQLLLNGQTIRKLLLPFQQQCMLFGRVLLLFNLLQKIPYFGQNGIRFGVQRRAAVGAKGRIGRRHGFVTAGTDRKLFLPYHNPHLLMIHDT